MICLADYSCKQVEPKNVSSRMCAPETTVAILQVVANHLAIVVVNSTIIGLTSAQSRRQSTAITKDYICLGVGVNLNSDHMRVLWSRYIRLSHCVPPLCTDRQTVVRYRACSTTPLLKSTVRPLLSKTCRYAGTVPQRWLMKRTGPSSSCVMGTHASRTPTLVNPRG